MAGSGLAHPSLPPEKYKALVAVLKPAFEASLDPICVVNGENRIMYMNMQMKNFLGIRLKDLENGVIFCDLVKLSSCRERCQILESIQSAAAMRFDETPATRGADKLRVSLKTVPLLDGPSRASLPVGAIITLRDTTGEILLQAKYHKLLELIHQKAERIEALEDKIESLRKSLRGARGAAGA